MAESPPYTFFLGGHDLEMLTIRDLLEQHGLSEQVCDKELRWGAPASAYADEIRAAIDNGRVPVLIELHNDLGLREPGFIHIDHHGPDAGSRPTALRQVFDLLSSNLKKWTRHHELVAANDRGHIAGMQEVGASEQEMRDVRMRDRAAQGISEEEENQAANAVRTAGRRANGLLTVVEAPHDRSAAVADRMERLLGGPGYVNLLILGPSEANFFGAGPVIAELTKRYGNSWCGGQLPERGFWGIQGAPEGIVDEIAELCLTPTTRAFHQILIWPLLLDRPDVPRDQWLDYWSSGIRNAVDESGANIWKETDLLARSEHVPRTRPNPAPDAEEQQRLEYSEFVYMHPFVRRLLYGDRLKYRSTALAPNPSMRLFTRTDVDHVEVELGLEEAATKPATPIPDPAPLVVERIQLYLTDISIAVLVVEVRNDVENPLDFRQVRGLLNRFRRVYPPFWKGVKTPRTGHLHAGYTPIRIRWTRSGKPVPAVGPKFHEAASFVDFVTKHLLPPVAGAWRHIASPLQPRESGAPRSSSLGVRQILGDDRMPTMAYLAMDRPEQLTEQDFARLVFIEEGGASHNWPYAQPFVGEHLPTHFYDRFWQPKAGYSARYLCAGYSFTVVGDANDQMFFRDPYAGALAHFRNHYFQLGLLVHLQRAALLAFQDRISDIAHSWRSGTTAFEEKRAEALAAVQDDFLHFLDLYWFREVSNQIQGQELFELWTAQLGNRELLEDVLREIRTVNDAIEAHAQAQLTKAATDQARVANTLAASANAQSRLANRIATWGAVFAVLAIGVTTADALINYDADFKSWFGWILLLSGAFAALLGFLVASLGPRD